MKARFVLACACLVQAAAFAGPRTPVTEFFAKHVDTSVPALADIPARMAAGDVVGAEKLFAAHVRATLRHDALNGDWIKSTPWGQTPQRYNCLITSKIE